MDSELMNLTPSVGVLILCPAHFVPVYYTHDVFPSVAFLLITFWNKIFSHVHAA